MSVAHGSLRDPATRADRTRGWIASRGNARVRSLVAANDLGRARAGKIADGAALPGLNREPQSVYIRGTL